MKCTINILFTIIALLLLSNSIQAQCTVDASATKYDIVCGDLVSLSAQGEGVTVFTEDFNDNDMSGWANTPSGYITGPGGVCGVPTPDNSRYLWFGSSANSPRSAESPAMDLRTGGTICWDMRYSNREGGADCEDPDAPDEGVRVQYSINGGGTWVNIPNAYWDPNGGGDPVLSVWNNYCVGIPAAAEIATAKIRWVQMANTQDAVSGDYLDHWGIDDVVITVNPPTAQYTWQHTGNPLPTGATPDLQPITTTIYTVEYTDGTNVCTDDVTINVIRPAVTAGANPINICEGDNSQLIGGISIIEAAPTSCAVTTNLGCKTITAPITGNINGAAVNGTSAISQLFDGERGRGQILYTANELTTLGMEAGKITELALSAAVVGTGGFDVPYAPGFQIHIKCTNKNVFNGNDYVAMTNADRVYGPIQQPFAVGWNTFQLDKAFEWDGSSNIVVQFCFDHGSASDETTIDLQTNDLGNGNERYIGYSTIGTGGCAHATGYEDYHRPIIRYTYCAPYSPPIDYSWSPDDGTFVPNTTTKSPTVAPTNTTTYTLSAKVAGAPAGCATTDDVVVNVFDVNNIFPTANSPCEGDAIQLMANAAGVTSWNWTGPGGYTSTAENPTRNTSTTAMSGTYTVTISNGTCSGSVSVDVTVVTPPNSGTPAPLLICYNEVPFNLFDQLAGEEKGGEWIDLGASGALVQDSMFDASKLDFNTLPASISMTYAIQTNACPEQTSSVSVSVNTPANAGTGRDSIICNEAGLISLFPILLDNPDLGGTWNDDDGTGLLNPDGTIDVTTLTGGIYDFTYTVSSTAPCLDSSATISVNVDEPSDAGTPTDIDLCYSSAPINLYNQVAGNDRPGGWRAVTACGGLEKDSIFNPAKMNPSMLPITCEVQYFTPADLRACPEQTVSVFINVDESPSAGGDSSATLCNTSGAIDLFTFLTGFPEATGSWTDESGKPTGQNQDLGTMSTGEHCFTYTVPAAAPCPEPTAVICITVEEQMEAGTGMPVVTCIGTQVNLATNNTGVTSTSGVWENHINNDLANVILIAPDVVVNNKQPTQGEFVFRYVVAPDSVCAADTAFVPLTINSYPVVGNLQIICAVDKKSFDVQIDLAGGDTATYSVTPVATLVGATYNQAGNPSPGTITYTLTDANGCGTSDTTITRYCDCVTGVGTMDDISDTIKVCLNDVATATYAGGFVNDGDDTLSYVLHDGAIDELGNVLDQSRTPSFSFVGAVIPGQVYYISAVAGNDLDLDGIADGTETCFKVAYGQPVVFYDYPTVSIASAATTYCPGTNIPLTFTMTGVGPWGLVLDTNGVIYDTIPLANYNDSYSIPAETLRSGNHTVSVREIIDMAAGGPKCANTSTGATLNLTILTGPQVVVTVSNTDFCDGDPVTFDFNMTSGDAGATYSIDYDIINTTTSVSTSGNVSVTEGSSSQITETGLTPGTYNFDFTSVVGSGSGCPGTGTDLIPAFSIHPKPVVTPLNSSYEVCVSGSTPLSVPFTTTGFDAVSFDVLDESSTVIGSYDGSVSNFTVPVNEVGTFVYTISNVEDGSSASCLGIGATVTVKVVPGPTINFDESFDSNDEFVFCDGEAQAVKFTTTGDGVLTTSTAGGEFSAVHTGIAGSYTGVLLNMLPVGTHIINVDLVDGTSALCPTSNQFTVVVKDNPFALIDFSGLDLCENTTYDYIPLIGLTVSTPNFDVSIHDVLNGVPLDEKFNVGAGTTITMKIGKIQQNGLAKFRLKLNDYTINESGNACVYDQIYNQIVYKQPIAEINVLTPSICDGDEAVIVISASHSDGSLFYYSNSENEISQNTLKPFSGTNSDTITFIPTSLGFGSPSQQYLYELTYLKDSYNCVANIIKPTDFLNVNPIPHVGFEEDTLAGCSPLIIEFSDTTKRDVPGSEIVSQVWDFGNGVTSGDVLTDFYQTYNSKRTVNRLYDVSLTAYNSQGCAATFTKVVTVYPDPEPYFIMTPAELDLVHNQAVFRNESGANVAENYWVIDGDTINFLDPSPVRTFDPVPNAEHRVCLHSISSKGCASIYCIEFTIKDREIIYIPNSFTPNSDKHNQIFKPVITNGLDPKTYHFTIFDRWGGIIFETLDVDEGWDGLSFNNELLPSGVYVYQIEGYGTIRPVKKIVKTGNVNLMR